MYPPAAPATHRRSKPKAWLLIFVSIWAIGVASGLSVLWAYENRPGQAADAPSQWPVETALRPGNHRPTLVFVAHPECTCTRASLDELAEILARTKNTPKTYVLFLKPASIGNAWDDAALLHQATALPGVTVLRDDDGREARRFGAETSGQTMLYDTDGHLIFSGGITGARGHAGENAGEAALVALLTGHDPRRHGASVFGCPLFATAD